MGIGDWGLGIGDWAQSPIPNPQSPITNPQSPINQIKIFDNAFTKGGTTYEKELNYNTQEDYELTGGKRNFDVKDIEVYEVIIE